MSERSVKAEEAKDGVANRVVELLLGQIRAGRLSPNEKLPSERDLARQLQVGRPSLREGLRALSLLGVLDIRHGEGIFVSNLSSSDLLEPLHFYLTMNDSSLDQLFEARIVIEAGIAGIATRTLDKEGVVVLKTCIEEGESSIDDLPRFLELDVLFHQTIVEAASNPFLAKTAEAFGSLARASRELTASLREIRVQSHRDHVAIFDALLYRDEEGASKAMEAHLRNVWHAYRKKAQR